MNEVELLEHATAIIRAEAVDITAHQQIEQKHRRRLLVHRVALYTGTPVVAGGAIFGIIELVRVVS